MTGQFNDELKAEFATVAEYGETAAEVCSVTAAYMILPFRCLSCCLCQICMCALL